MTKNILGQKTAGNKRSLLHNNDAEKSIKNFGLIDVSV
jgi:hypothetical protein